MTVASECDFESRCDFESWCDIESWYEIELSEVTAGSWPDSATGATAADSAVADYCLAAGLFWLLAACVAAFAAAVVPSLAAVAP